MLGEDALGVLLVHGIGEKEKGDTLLEFGEPIVQWIGRWPHAKKGQGLQIDRLVLTIFDWMVLVKIILRKKGATDA